MGEFSAERLGRGISVFWRRGGGRVFCRVALGVALAPRCCEECRIRFLLRPILRCDLFMRDSMPPCRRGVLVARPGTLRCIGCVAFLPKNQLYRYWIVCRSWLLRAFACACFGVAEHRLARSKRPTLVRGFRDAGRCAAGFFLHHGLHGPFAAEYRLGAAVEFVARSGIVRGVVGIMRLRACGAFGACCKCGETIRSNAFDHCKVRRDSYCSRDRLSCGAHGFGVAC